MTDRNEEANENGQEDLGGGRMAIPDNTTNRVLLEEMTQVAMDPQIRVNATENFNEAETWNVTATEIERQVMDDQARHQTDMYRELLQRPILTTEDRQYFQHHAHRFQPVNTTHHTRAVDTRDVWVDINDATPTVDDIRRANETPRPATTRYVTTETIEDPVEEDTAEEEEPITGMGNAGRNPYASSEAEEEDCYFNPYEKERLKQKDLPFSGDKKEDAFTRSSRLIKLLEQHALQCIARGVDPDFPSVVAAYDELVLVAKEDFISNM